MGNEEIVGCISPDILQVLDGRMMGIAGLRPPSQRSSATGVEDAHQELQLVRSVTLRYPTTMELVLGKDDPCPVGGGFHICVGTFGVIWVDDIHG